MKVNVVKWGNTTFSPAKEININQEDNVALGLESNNGGSILRYYETQTSIFSLVEVEETLDAILELMPNGRKLPVLKWNENEYETPRNVLLNLNKSSYMPYTYKGQNCTYLRLFKNQNSPMADVFVIEGIIPDANTALCLPPENLSATIQIGDNGFAEANLSWNAASSVTSSTPKYVVFLNNRDVIYSGGSNTNNYVWQGMVNGESYSFEVITLCQNGNQTSQRGYTPFNVNMGNTLAEVTGVVVGSITSTSALVSFTAPTAAGVTYAVANENGTQSNEFASSPISLTGLTPNTTYNFKIRTFINSQLSRISSIYTFTTLP